MVLIVLLRNITRNLFINKQERSGKASRASFVKGVNFSNCHNDGRLARPPNLSKVLRLTMTERINWKQAKRKTLSITTKYAWRYLYFIRTENMLKAES